MAVKTKDLPPPPKCFDNKWLRKTRFVIDTTSFEVISTFLMVMASSPLIDTLILKIEDAKACRTRANKVPDTG